MGPGPAHRIDRSIYIPFGSPGVADHRDPNASDVQKPASFKLLPCSREKGREDSKNRAPCPIAIPDEPMTGISIRVAQLFQRREGMVLAFRGILRRLEFHAWGARIGVDGQREFFAQRRG